MTFGETLSELYDHFGYQQTPATEVSRRLKRYVNDTYRELVSMQGASILRRGLLTFASVANSPFCVLPQAVSKVRFISDRTTLKTLYERSLADLRMNDPGLSATTSAPDYYTILNLVAAVAKDPSAAAELFIKSDNAGDTQVARIEGVTTGGYPRIANVTLTGTTAVSFGATITDWIAVTKFNLATAAVGNVTLREASGVGTELARISPGRTYAHYTRLHLYPTPTSSLTYYADVDRQILDLVSDDDVSMLPEDFHWLLTSGAMVKEYTKRQVSEMMMSESARFRDGKANLQLWIRKPSGPEDGGRPIRFSQLGPWFPPGS